MQRQTRRSSIQEHFLDIDFSRLLSLTLPNRKIVGTVLLLGNCVSVGGRGRKGKLIGEEFGLNEFLWRSSINETFLIK